MAGSITGKTYSDPRTVLLSRLTRYLVWYKQTVIGRAWALLRPLLAMKCCIATRHVFLVSIESTDGMRVSSVVLAG